mgnify:CR=1 FL=1
MDHFLTSLICLFSTSNLKISVQQSMRMQCSLYFLFMLISINFEEFITFEFCINRSNLLLFSNFFRIKFFVLLNNALVLPCTPYLVLNFLLLLWGLLNCVNYYPFSSIYFNELISFLLLYYHLSSTFLSLMFLFFCLISSNSLFLSSFFSYS